MTFLICDFWFFSTSINTYKIIRYRDFFSKIYIPFSSGGGVLEEEGGGGQKRISKLIIAVNVKLWMLLRHRIYKHQTQLIFYYYSSLLPMYFKICCDLFTCHHRLIYVFIASPWGQWRPNFKKLSVSGIYLRIFYILSQFLTEAVNGLEKRFCTIPRSSSGKQEYRI